MIPIYTQGGHWRSLEGHSATYFDWNVPLDDQAEPDLLRGDKYVSTDEDVHDLLSDWHPLDDNVSNCAALLYMHTGVRSRWVSIPCNKTYKESRALCSTRHNLTKENLKSDRDLEGGNASLCPPSYINFHGICHKINVLSSESQLPLRRRNVHPLQGQVCIDWMRHVPTVFMTFLESLESYVFFPFSAIMATELDQSYCFLLRTCSPEKAHLWARENNTSKCDHYKVRVDLEKPKAAFDYYNATECPIGTYQCHTGTCTCIRILSL